MHECRVCGNRQGNNFFTAREMMLGYRDAFEYVECNRCGCLQIRDIPSNLSKYYPSDYYSLKAQQEGWFKQFVKRQRARFALGVSQNPMGWVATKIWGRPPLMEWLKPTKICLDAAVLDVGSGAGRELLDLKNAGFTNLTGIDPYIKEDISYGRSLQVLKQSLEETQGLYDVLLVNHVFEHLADPKEALKQMARLLPSGHFTVLRTPVAGCYAWRRYKTNWVQLDAPRHLHLHTEQSIQHLASQTGFEVWKVVFDSGAFQFYGSEQYQQDIPLRNGKPGAAESLFSTQQMQRWKEKAVKLNKQKDGDQACFYLRRL